MSKKSVALVILTFSMFSGNRKYVSLNAPPTSVMSPSQDWSVHTTCRYPEGERDSITDVSWVTEVNST